ncbi:MAG: tetratricopeptide repeat protein [Thermodesulfobacteriota bacterium]|nr:tetratricopeptide repeat protein [Thermodesulfobacteriota bacterium]
MILDEFLTAKDRVALKQLPLTLELRKNSSCLVIIGADSVELGDAFSQYISMCLKGDAYFFHTPKTELILPEIVDSGSNISLDKYIIIKLYDQKLTDAGKLKINSGLLLYRDYIPEYNLKLVFILSHDLMRYLQTSAYDFFSFSNYSRFFFDHKYRYERIDTDNRKLSTLIKELDTYLSANNKKTNIILEKIFSIIDEAYQKSEADIALDYSHKLLNFSTKSNDKFYQAAALSNIGLIYRDKGDADNALKYHMQALEIHKEIGYKQGEASDLGNIGLIYSDKGDADNALKYHMQALEIHKEIGYKQGEASDLGNIGIIYRVKGDADNALKYHMQALEIDKEIGYKQGEASDLGNIGLIYRDKGDADNALKYLMLALEIAKKYKFKSHEKKIKSSLDEIKF